MATVPLGEIPALNAARLGEDAIALKHGDVATSWGELEARATHRAWALKGAGVGQDDLVTIALPNCAAFYEITFALWKLGATPHVVSWRLPRLELAAILEIARPRLLVASEPSLVSAFGGVDPAGGLIEERLDPLPRAIARHWKAMSSGGSTGRPKIILSHMRGEIDPETPVIRIPRDAVILNPGPLYHNAPFSQTHHALFRGNTVVNMAKFDAEEALRLIAENQVRWVNFVPTMMLRMWRLPQQARELYDLSSLESVWHMAAPMPAWLKEAWIDWLGPEKIWEFYGGAEGQGATIVSGTEWLEHRGSVGRPVNCEIRILDEERRLVPTGEVGEIYFRHANGPGSTYHYVGALARSADEGFESIGDFGWMDPEGYLYLADRRTDLILSGGANIYPAEVESALMEHPGVDVAVVVGLPHEDLGAAVHAIVRPRPEWGAALDQPTLSAFVSERLARYKIPRSYEFTDEPLRDDAGKVRRSQLREDRLRA